MKKRDLFLLVFVICGSLCLAQQTKKINPLLSRRKRYLLFPEGSNLVMTLSMVKALMIKAPKLTNVLAECDVPFKLPSDPKILRIKRSDPEIHYRQRREVYSQLEDALTSQGLNGNACVKRMMCDVEKLLPDRGESLIADVLQATFAFSMNETSGDDAFKEYCHESTYKECPIPLIEYFMGSLISS